MLLSNCRLISKTVVEFSNFSFKHSIFFMESKTKSVYEEAVYALNGLQSNSATIKKAAEERSSKSHLNLTNTARHLKTLGIMLEDLDSLNVIHVAGTKGKGSTCAFTESVLRKHGYKTGFYSSPHLISVNERIRINGVPLPKDIFAKYFWEVYETIQLSLSEGETMPPYFLFLTVMAYYVFVKEQVQAAVVEVGLGGLYDCTNIIRKPVVVGISTLGIDHVNILGNTITEIAKQKAGIFKPNVPSFTVPQQESAMEVLRAKAQEIGCPLLLSPPVEAYDEKISLGIQGIVQNVNVSLALQLTNTWLRQQNEKSMKCMEMLKGNSGIDVKNEKSIYFPLPMSPTFQIDAKTQDALESCTWPGRFQTVEKGKVTFYLDGAHTQQSMKYCVRWFEKLSTLHKEKYKQPVVRLLLFNCTGERKAEGLLDPLSDIHFDLVMFSPNRISVMKDSSSDLSNFMVDPEQEIERCATNKEIWCHLMRSLYENELRVNSSTPRSEFSSMCNNTFQFPSISRALKFILSDSSELITSANHIQVLVTGSLHLVGGVLSLIDS